MPYISGETATTSGQKEMGTRVSKYIHHPLSQTANYAIIQLENSPKKTIVMYPGLYSRARVRLNGSTESGVNSGLDSSCFFLQVVLKIIKKTIRSNFPNRNNKLTGVAAIKAAPNSQVVELRATKSEATRVDTPPKGKASKRGFLVTMAVSTSIIVGSKASTSSRMVSASDSATGVGTA